MVEIPPGFNEYKEQNPDIILDDYPLPKQISIYRAFTARLDDDMTDAEAEEQLIQKLGGEKEFLPEGREIQLGKNNLRDTTFEVREAILEYNSRKPRLFRRGGKFARIALNDQGDSVIQSLDNEKLLKNALLPIAVWTRWDKTERRFVPSQPHTDLVSNLMAEPDLIKICPEIQGITDIPLLSPDGNVMPEKGFDKATGQFYTGRYKIKVPKAPTKEEIQKAADLIEEVFIDFPLKHDDKCSRVNMMAALITAVLRAFFDNPPPMFVISKNVVGVGGSKVSKVVSIVATGVEEPKMLGWSQDDEEVRKGITTQLMLGSKIIIYDNVSSKAPIASDALARLVTSNTWGDRTLGSNTDVSIKNQTIVMVNGNNVSFVSDLARRSIPIRLSTDNPSYTTTAHNWKHDPLEAWVVQQRANLIRAVYVLYIAWLRADKPKPKTTMASFEAWLHVVGGMLEVAGKNGLRGNVDEESLDTGMDELNRMVVWLRSNNKVRKTEKFEAGFTASSLYERLQDEKQWPTEDNLMDALPDELLGLPQAKFTLMVGRWLKSVCDKPSTEKYKISKLEKKATGGKTIWIVRPNNATEQRCIDEDA